jgi:hypothetical protein
MNSHELLLVDHFAKENLSVGFNPLFDEFSGIKSSFFGGEMISDPRAKARGNSIIIHLNSCSYNINLTAMPLTP